MKAGIHSILLQPLLTEKITAMRENNNTVGFLVHPDANRVQIKQAVETLLKVKVERVNVDVRDLLRRHGRAARAPRPGHPRRPRGAARVLRAGRERAVEKGRRDVQAARQRFEAHTRGSQRHESHRPAALVPAIRTRIRLRSECRAGIRAAAFRQCGHGDLRAGEPHQHLPQ